MRPDLPRPRFNDGPPPSVAERAEQRRRRNRGALIAAVLWIGLSAFFLWYTHRDPNNPYPVHYTPLPALTSAAIPAARAYAKAVWVDHDCAETARFEGKYLCSETRSDWGHTFLVGGKPVIVTVCSCVRFRLVTQPPGQWPFVTTIDYGLTDTDGRWLVASQETRNGAVAECAPTGNCVAGRAWRQRIRTS